ncbi:hypothetical protein ABHI18_001971 [Aspergillus niger]
MEDNNNNNNTDPGFGERVVSFPSFLYIREGAAGATVSATMLTHAQPREYPVAGLTSKRGI